MTVSIFSHTSVILSNEVTEKLGSIPQNETDLHQICKENSINFSTTENKQCILEGEWTSMISAFNKISMYLDIKFNLKTNILTFQYDTCNEIDYASKLLPSPRMFPEDRTIPPLSADNNDSGDKEPSSPSDWLENNHDVDVKFQVQSIQNKTTEKQNIAKDNLLENLREEPNDIEPKCIVKAKKSCKRTTKTGEKIIYLLRKRKTNLHESTTCTIGVKIQARKLDDSTRHDKGDECQKIKVEDCFREDQDTGNHIKSNDTLMENAIQEDGTQFSPSKKRKVHKKKKEGTITSCDEEPRLSCPECEYTAKKKARLNEHMQRMHGICKSWGCNFCDKAFSLQRDLVRHQITHEEPQLFCDICGKVYKAKRTLDQHKMSHDKDFVKPVFSCEICNKTFSTKYILKMHIKSEHQGQKSQHLCQTCGKSFSQKSSYVQHMNVHMGLKPYQCEHCGKSFPYEKSLKEHRYMHDDELHFKCDVCNKEFRQKSSLQIHQKIHKETKDHICQTCGKGFTQKQALLRHERIHSGKKPFSCRLCNKCFSDASIIRRHMILVHKKNSKEWREDVVSDLEGAKNYWIDGEVPNRVRMLPTNKSKTADDKTDIEEKKSENSDVSNNVKIDITSPNVQETSQSTSQTLTESLIPQPMYLVTPVQHVQEDSKHDIYIHKNQTETHNESHEDLLNTSNLSQYINNSSDSSITVPLEQTYNDSFTSLQDRKTDNLLLPFQSTARTENQWAAEPFSYNNIQYLSHYNNCQGQ